MKKKTTFYTCSKCGKKLIGRKANGTFVFLFATNQSPPLVHIEIFGSIRMRCLRRSCRKNNPSHWNVFTFFPDGFAIAGTQSIGSDPNTSPANPANEEKEKIT